MTYTRSHHGNSSTVHIKRIAQSFYTLCGFNLRYEQNLGKVKGNDKVAPSDVCCICQKRRSNYRGSVQ